MNSATSSTQRVPHRGTRIALASALAALAVGAFSGPLAANAAEPQEASSKLVEWEPMEGVYGSIESTPEVLVEGVPTTVDYVATIRNDTGKDIAFLRDLVVSVGLPISGYEMVDYEGELYSEAVYAKPIDGSVSATSSPERLDGQHPNEVRVGEEGISLGGWGLYAGETVTLRYQAQYNGGFMFDSQYCVLAIDEAEPDEPNYEPVSPDDTYYSSRNASVESATASNYGRPCIQHSVPVVPQPEVVAVAPKVSESTECGVESTVSIPEVEGIAYTETREGSTITVTARAESGYILAEGSETNWTFTIPEAEKCLELEEPVIPSEPVEPKPSTPISEEEPTNPATVKEPKVDLAQTGSSTMLAVGAAALALAAAGGVAMSIRRRVTAE